MMHDSDWEAAAHVGRHKMNLMGSRRTKLKSRFHACRLGLGRIYYGGIDIDVLVNFKSEGASNKIQLVMDKCELSHNMLTLTSPLSYSAVCEL